MIGRRALKVVVFFLASVIVLPFVGLTWLEKRGLRTNGVFVAFSQLLSLLPDPFGSPFRAAYYFGSLDECSWEVRIGFGTQFTHREARLGSRVSLGRYCIIGHAIIEQDVRIASRVSIPSGKRQHLDSGGSMEQEATRFEYVGIGAGSWIGEGAIVLAKVGKGCVVAAGSVVVHEVEDGRTVGGNPARELKRTSGNA